MTMTAITHARVFDGERVREESTVVLDGPVIAAVGGEVPAGAEIVDARGATLLPGLFDAHTHTSEEALAFALRFGVTTELEMQGAQTRPRRAHIEQNDAVADVRSAGFGITPPGGHPSELFPEGKRPGGDGDPAPGHADDLVMPFASTPEEAIAFIPKLIESGSDYIKFMVDDGTVEGHPGLPCLDQATLNAGVAEARRRGMLTVAHALTLDATRMAVEAGVDGLVHIFMDQPHTEEIIQLIAGSGMFVVPCVVLNASMMGITGENLASDERVASRLDEAWLTTLRGSFDRYPQGKLDDVLATVGALHEAGVDLLVGSDASVPVPFLGGVAHGASVHDEMWYLVQAGLSPVEALRAATVTPARRFSLDDRGRIAEGLRADLLLVSGDPTTHIGHSLDIRAVWRRGTCHWAA
ncbi:MULTISPECIES: amidohydrolase family protein [unclassified Streptomyces]|uniref:amidohydrolase family protein n=1 Tax=unclassified Streptomyces TaxID=2593676 RepID=UPI000C274560|nr:amidohydrolase family protein [Streptomyces sp. CB01373]PJM91802.1 imidazolonepropionase [Streptomyces sp. CB01373]